MAESHAKFDMTCQLKPSDPASDGRTGGAGECLPVISLAPLLSELRDEAAVAALARQLLAACRDVGFFFITEHGMSAREMERLLSLCVRLFDLPAATKAALDAGRSPLARGYGSLERGKHSCTPEDGQRDAKESFTLGMERAAGDARPPSPMHGPNQWPPEGLLPGWRADAEACVAALLSVARLLMRGLALALQLPEGFFTSKATDPVAQLCLFRYPPGAAATSASPSGPARGCGAHTDCGLLTFVAQDAPGIEVQLPDGSWHVAPALPGALLVNLGDLFQFWTGGVFKSTVHRVVNRSPDAPRHSAVWFCNADFDAPVEVLGQQQQQPGQPVMAGEYILQQLGLMHK